MSKVLWCGRLAIKAEDEDHKLNGPQCIATNTTGEFAGVLDGTSIKMYNSSGGFLHHSCLPRDCKFQFHTVDADIDRESNFYVLAWKASQNHGKKHRTIV